MATLAQQGLTSIFDTLEAQRQASGYYQQTKVLRTKAITAKDKGVKPCSFKVGDLVRGTSFVWAGSVTKVEKLAHGWCDVSFLVTHEVCGNKIKKLSKANQREVTLRHDAVQGWGL